MKFSIRVQLSLMMFLNFFVWGVWYVTMGTFLKSIPAVTDVQVGLAYGTQSLGAIIAPFVIGLIADRYFSAQKILGILHLFGAAILYYISGIDGFASFYPAIFVYMVIYMPTLALVNAVSFKQMANPAKEFSLVRLWGTIGWIVAGLIIGWMAWEQNNGLANTFKLAAVVSLVLGIFSFTLPDTPPPRKGTKTPHLEFFDIHHHPLMDSFADQVAFIGRLEAKLDGASFDRQDFSGRDHPHADRCGRDMRDIKAGAKALMTGGQQVFASGQRGGLKQIDHHRGGEHMNLPGTDARRSMFIGNTQRCGADGTDWNVCRQTHARERFCVCDARGAVNQPPGNVVTPSFISAARLLPSF